MEPLWGIDLGGTKIEGVVLESSTEPNALKRLRVPTEADKGYHHIMNQIVKLIEVLTAEIGMRPTKVGICTPGTLDPHTGTMKNSNTTCINGMPLKEDLENILNMEINMANDANCFAIAETQFGAVAETLPDAKVVFGVIMGSGVGGGVVVNGNVLNGRQGIGGEWGHNPLDESGGNCYCGKVGCVETIISGKSLERYYKDLTGDDINHRLDTVFLKPKLGDSAGVFGAALL